MSRPRLLDLYCKAGGAAAGYVRAGFDVIGVDREPQPHYPYEFMQADVLALPLDYLASFDAIHASPPCQKYSTMTGRWEGKADEHPDLIPSTRMLLVMAGRPYAIENVPGAPLLSPITLCGSMFGLAVRRHRRFESNIPMLAPTCDHASQGRVVGVYGHAGGSSKRDGISFGGVDTWKTAMGIDWMTGNELAEAIPPAYTAYIGSKLIEALG